MGHATQSEAREVSRSLADRFNQASPATLLVKTASKTPIVLSHVLAPTPTGQKTQTPTPEAAFALHVHLAPLLDAETWIDGRHADLPPVVAGALCLFDLSASPVALVREPMDFLRVYISQRTLDDLAYDQGRRPVSGLRAPSLGHYDPVLHSLACAFVAQQEAFGETDTLFADYLALAFHAHALAAFGDSGQARAWRGGLAPWQLHRACELMVAHLAEGVTIAELAQACDVSASYFSRAFKLTAGVPPHRWLMNERVERAKSLLRHSDLSLSDIALACGFTDQSHFSRVFSHHEGRTPGRWRRLCLQ